MSNIYLSTSNGLVIEWNPLSGALVEAKDLGRVYTDIAAAPDGRLYGITSSALYEIDFDAGTDRFIGNLDGFVTPIVSGLTQANGFDISDDGVGLISSGNLVTLVTVDLEDGSVSNAGGMSFSTSAGDVLFQGDRVFVSTNSNNLAELVEVGGNYRQIGSEFTQSRDLMGLADPIRPGDGITAFVGDAAYDLSVPASFLGPGLIQDFGFFGATITGATNKSDGEVTPDLIEGDFKIRLDGVVYAVMLEDGDFRISAVDYGSQTEVTDTDILGRLQLLYSGLSLADRLIDKEILEDAIFQTDDAIGALATLYTVKVVGDIATAVVGTAIVKVGFGLTSVAATSSLTKQLIGQAVDISVDVANAVFIPSVLNSLAITAAGNGYERYQAPTDGVFDAADVETLVTELLISKELLERAGTIISEDPLLNQKTIDDVRDFLANLVSPLIGTLPVRDAVFVEDLDELASALKRLDSLGGLTQDALAAFGTGIEIDYFSDKALADATRLFEENFVNLTGDDTAGTETGSEANDVIMGRGGADVLQGLQGSDRLDGGTGDDTIDGGSGDDFLWAGTGNDDAKGGTGKDQIFGNEGQDVLRGGRGQDFIDGGRGNDILRGQRDADELIGGAGDDNIKGGGGNDSLYGDTGADFLKGGTRRDEIFGGDGDDRLLGNSFEDLLVGGSGNDRLIAGGDDDTLDGGSGNDFLRGGAGKDTFVFNSGDGQDVFDDFDVTQDTLQLGAFGLTAAQVADLGVVDNGNLVLSLSGSDGIVMLGVTSTAGLSDAIEV